MAIGVIARRHARRHHAGAHGFLLDQAPHALLEREEGRFALDRSVRAGGRSTSITSLMCAGRAENTTTRFDRKIASLIWWVMNSAVVRGARENLQQFHLHELAGLRVERRERLVEQDQLRLHHQGARDVDALAHAAGQLVRIMLGEARRPTRSMSERRAPHFGLDSLPWISRP